MNKKISIFIPYYNDKKYLNQSIDSVLSQNYTNFELILFDHGSTDDSKAIAHSYKDKRIKHMGVEKNYYYMNGFLWQKIIASATGDYLKPFCADDIMLPNCLEDSVDFLEGNQEYVATFAWMQPFDEKGDISMVGYEFADKLDRYQKINSHFNGKYMFLYPTAMMKMDAIRQITLDKVALQLLDISTWIKLLLLGDIGILHKKTVKYRHHDEQPSTSANPQIAKFKRRELFERQFILDIFVKITDLKLLKRIFPENKEIQDLADIKFIPFLVCLQAMQNKNDNLMHWRAITLLYEMLQDDVLSGEIEKKFGFTIANLRHINYRYTVIGDKDFAFRALFKRFIVFILAKTKLLSFAIKIKTAYINYAKR